MDAKKVKGKGATTHHETTNGLLIHEKCRHDVEGFLRIELFQRELLFRQKALLIPIMFMLH